MQNLEKVSVSTRTFSFQFLLGSNFIKSISNRSIGLFATIDPEVVQDLCMGPSQSDNTDNF